MSNFLQNDYAKVFTLPVSIAVSAFLYCKYQAHKQEEDILTRLKQKQEDVARNKSHFQAEFSQVSPRQADILSLSYDELRDGLQDGTLKAVEVLKTFLAKAVEVDKKTNAVTEFLEDALEQARALDEMEPEERGPLHGIPISLKEHIHLSGLDCTVGIPGKLRHPSPNADATLVQMFKQLGAVPFCRTNLAQTCYSYDCSNPIFGVTTNYRSDKRSPGGSSGGEGALVAGGGSIFGIGSDLGGSIRIPSMFSGVPSLKPTAGRLALAGQGSDGGLVGVVGVHNSLGFLTRSVGALEDCMRQLCSQGALERMKVDARLVPMQWSEDKAKPGQRLKIGWYDFDGILLATPGCRRAVRETRDLLQAQGHSLVEFQPPRLQRVYELFWSLENADTGLTTLRLLEHSPVDWQSIGPTYQMFKRNQYRSTRLINWLRRKLGLGTEDLFGRESVELWELNAERLALIEDILRAWKEQDLDVVIGPGMSVPTLPLGYPSRLFPAICYTLVYNLLNFPAGSVPVTEETPSDQKDLLYNYPGYEHSKTYGLMKEGSCGALGMPLSVQVIGRPWSEELVLRVMKEIENKRE